MQVCSPVLLARPCGLLPEREQKEEAPSESAPGGLRGGDTGARVHLHLWQSFQVDWPGRLGVPLPPRNIPGPRAKPPHSGRLPGTGRGRATLGLRLRAIPSAVAGAGVSPGDGAPRGRMLMTHGWLPPLCPPSHSLLCRWKRRERGWRAGDTAWARGILSGVLYLLSDPSPISVLRLGPRGLRCRKAGAGTSLRKQTEAPLVPEQQHSGHGASGSPCLWAHGNCLLSLQ